MAKKKIKVEGLEINIEDDFISLTDIAQKADGQEARYLIRNWINNHNTIEFLEAWEIVHNPNFKRAEMGPFKIKYHKNSNVLSPKRWISEMDSIGMISKKGRYGGGTWAHKDIAFNFCYWLSPAFQVYVTTEFQRLKEAEAHSLGFEWHIRKITDNIDEVRNLLDTLPGQLPELNRLISRKKKEE